MYKILVVEDEQRVADLIKRGLEECCYAVSVAFDGEMALRLTKTITFDLIISDVILPKLNGFELVKEIRNNHPNIPILMLTALGTTDDKLDGFNAGADDYMVKPFSFRELNARIIALMKRSGQTREEELINEYQYADLKIDIPTQTVFRGADEIKLTPKEFKLLAYMIQNPERVLTRTEIAENVWGAHFDTGTNFIDVYISYLRKKIDKDYGNKLIHTKPAVGFILKSEE